MPGFPAAAVIFDWYGQGREL